MISPPFFLSSGLLIPEYRKRIENAPGITGQLSRRPLETTGGLGQRMVWFRRKLVSRNDVTNYGKNI
jgi:hypothetical protein